MKCLKCESYMTHMPVRHKYYYDMCNNCGGRWVDGSVLHRHCRGLFTSGKNSTFKHFMQQRVDITDYDCPECEHRKLYLVVVNNAEIEFCGHCHGVYFDITEMQACMPEGNWHNPEGEYDRGEVAGGIAKILFRVLTG